MRGEASRIDGAAPMRFFRDVVVPLAAVNAARSRS
jgi:ABC-type glycerol-3-phosphate transport system permease component